jgi:hypothetical protein
VLHRHVQILLSLCAAIIARKLQALKKLEETWSKVEFVFTPHRNGEVFTVKMAEEDFDILEDNQVQVQVWGHAMQLFKGLEACVA